MAKAKKKISKTAPARGKNIQRPAPSKSKVKIKARPLKAKSKAKSKPAVKKPVARKAAPVTPKRPSGLPEQLRDAALKVLNERQAEEIASFDLAGQSSVADYLIVASGRASRQLAAIAHYLSEAFAKLGVQRTRIEGLPEANWVLVDGGDVIIHLFLPEVRGYYNLEDIWGRRQPK